MNDFTKAVLASVLGSALFTGVAYLAEVRFSVLTQLRTPVEPYLEFVVIGVGTFILLYVGIRRYFRNKRDIANRNTPGAWAVSGSPRYPEMEGELEKFGVVWKAVYGSDRQFGGSNYVYVEGCYCPECDIELDAKRVSKWLFWQRRVWLCPACESTYDRPKHYRGDTRDAVESIFKAEFEDED